MTTRHEPVCRVKDCPHPTDDDFHRCPVCGKQAVQHHHYPSRAQAGKGAKVVAALCQYHHDKISLHQWREGVYRHGDGSLRYYVQNLKGEEQCERIIEAAREDKDADRETPKGMPSKVIESGQATQNGEDETLPQDVRDHGGPLHEVVGQSAAQCVRQGEPDLDAEGLGGIDLGEPTPAPETNAIATSQIGATDENPLVGLGVGDWAAVPDEQLAALFAEADKKQAEGFLLKCRIVHTFRERHVQAWGKSWTESAYDLFHISRRTLNAYANLHEICDTSDRYLIEQIAPLTDSKSLMTHIGRKKVEDGKVALEAAVSYQAEFAEPPTVKALMHKLGEEAKPPETCPESEDGKHKWFCLFCDKEK